MQTTAAPQRPTISVIVPAHNAATTLGACLAALAASTGPAREVIVVDDASTDATSVIAAHHGARLVALARRSGAALARNVGAYQAAAPLLFFVDADVLVTPTVLDRAVATLHGEPAIAAVFGSYTAETVSTNFCSVYKNLMHHVTHQAAHPEATTFWSGAGAIRAAAFWAVGGFDPADTSSADVEDIALGYRLSRAGYRLRLDRDLQVMHLKRYSLGGLIRSDLFHRAIPWTRLMLRERIYRNDLNTGGGSLVSALAVLLLGPALVGGLISPPLYGVAALLLLTVVALNRRLIGAVAHRDRRFLLPGIGMTALYYAYSTLGAAIGLALHLARLRSSARHVPDLGPAPAAGLPAKGFE